MGEIDGRLKFCFNHSKWLYQGLIRVPLIAHWPGRIPAGKVVGEVVELVDLAPTIFDLASDTGFRTEGKSLAGHIVGGGIQERPALAFSELRRLSEMDHAVMQTLPDGSFHRAAVQDRRHKLILSEKGGTELYDLDEDPEETMDLSASLPEVRGRLLGALEGWLAGAGAGVDDEEQEIPAEKRETLKALGYVD